MDVVILIICVARLTGHFHITEILMPRPFLTNQKPAGSISPQFPRYSGPLLILKPERGCDDIDCIKNIIRRGFFLTYGCRSGL